MTADNRLSILVGDTHNMNSFLRVAVVLTMSVILYSRPILAREWQDLISALHSEDARVSESAWKELRSISHLEEKLKEALKSDSRNEALFIISKLQSLPLAQILLAEQISHPVDSNAIFVLNEFLASDIKKKLMKSYSLWIEDKTLSSDFRLAVLSGLVKAKYQVPKKVLVSFLSDNSYQLRLEATRLAGLYQGEYLSILYEAKLLQPYQVRLEAYYWIAKLSPRLRKSMEITSALCEKESNTEVRVACQKTLVGKL
jgi:hypothetical protein